MRQFVKALMHYAVRFFTYGTDVIPIVRFCFGQGNNVYQSSLARCYVLRRLKVCRLAFVRFFRAVYLTDSSGLYVLKVIPILRPRLAVTPILRIPSQPPGGKKPDDTSSTARSDEARSRCSNPNC